MVRVVVCAVSMVLAVLPACTCAGAPAAPPEERDAGAGADAGAACSVDDDCALGQQCAAGTCVDAHAVGGDRGCRSDADCASGSRCATSTGKCVVVAPGGVVPGGPPGPCNAGDERTCGSKVGICDYGVKVCGSDGQWSGACNGAVGPDPRGELCNGLDDDCNGDIDEVFGLGAACTDGLGVCMQTGVVVCSADGLGTECTAHGLDPTGRVELCGNGIDDNCDGNRDEGFVAAGTGCTIGAGACATPGTLECSADALSLECIPDASGTEICNGADDDGDGCTDEGFDVGAACTSGFGACRRSGVKICSVDHLGTVCDAVPGVPAAVEACNGIDDTCDNVVDEGCDDDGDGYCDATLAFGGAPVAACPLSTSAALLDCNDNDAAIHPGAQEICNNGVDEDCDGSLTNGCAACNPAIDADFDGSNQCNDCDETNGAVHPGAVELCDGIDNNCDGNIDEGFDVDGDGFTTCGTKPGGGLDPSLKDCDDTRATVHPGACELCANAAGTVACGAANDRGNGIDENCNGFIDETCSPCDAVDHDGDGFSQCQGDCDDTAGGRNIHPGAPEICDGKDDDCNKFTVDNCGVSGKCNFDGDGNPANDADVCADRLLCVESLSAGGNPTGNFSCTSFCNITAPGVASQQLGDFCAADQTCGAALTPTDNIHGCAVTTGFGAAAPGTTCSSDGQCRSGRCVKDGRFTGNVKYCFDFCASDAYCPATTTCQASTASETGECLRVHPAQSLAVGATCTAGTAFECTHGSAACISEGAALKCSEPCCTNTDCGAGQFCSLKGTATPGPNGGVDTVPMCLPDSAGNGGRPGGAACTTSAQCASEFCDVNLGVCVDLCCNDETCPAGLSCENEKVTLASGSQTFARVCESTPPAAPLEAR